MYEDIVLYALKVAEDLGASYAEVRYHRIDGFGIASRNGSIIAAGTEVNDGIGIRVLVNGALGFSSTNVLDRESIRRAVEDAYRAAYTHSRFMKKPIEFAPAKVGRASYSIIERESFDSMDIDQKTSMHRELWDRVSKSNTEAKVKIFTLNYTEFVEEKVILNTDGAYIRSRIPRLSVFYNIVVSHPQKGSIQRFEQLGGSGGLEQLKQWNVEDTVVEEAKVLEKILTSAIEPPREEIPVIVGSEIVALIVHESCGHPSEADRILGREAAQAGKSFIKPGMIGERIGNKHASVIDDPTIPNSYGFYLYDDEGVSARPRYLYREGIINEFLHNRATAQVFNVNSNAAARAMNYGSEPIVRMANTYLKPGDYSFDELLDDVKLGVYMKSFMEWNIDDERWSQRYVGLEAYLIENGEITKFVRNPVLEVTTRAFYSLIDAVGKNLRFYAGTCGKGEPMQGVPVWFGGPDVRLSKIRLGVA
ncbi:MAG: TldD/PmbA family protein [Ignisphaera sp.]|nr:TldD/PmbA family protein [Ignisphaera sp.]MCX8167727.1 TldD/PmbA family protein [Ignisphaera sp.]MDW8085291.1 TldD/PmbA family protein [Ignisphaera sp.]